MIIPHSFSAVIVRKISKHFTIRFSWRDISLGRIALFLGYEHAGHVETDTYTSTYWSPVKGPVIEIFS